MTRAPEFHSTQLLTRQINVHTRCKVNDLHIRTSKNLTLGGSRDREVAGSIARVDGFEEPKRTHTKNEHASHVCTSLPPSVCKSTQRVTRERERETIIIIIINNNLKELKTFKKYK